MSRIGMVLAGAMAFAVVGAETNSVMSVAYWAQWNPEIQSQIDRDIIRNRQAEASVVLKDVKPGTEVKVEQLSHAFIFGAHIFNFDQLGTAERNRKYKELFGTLFNSATIAFYWKTFEPQPGKPRFEAAEQDTETFWNTVAKPKQQPHWRRPATDPVVAFCEGKGIRLHGHPIIWGNRKWHHPEWLFKQVCPAEERAKILALGKGLNKLTPEEIAALAPTYTREMQRLFEKRVVELAERYKGRVQSWDVVNESATDFKRKAMVPGDAICKSHYGLMPGDYTWQAFQTAARLFPKEVKLNINDYLNNADYTRQVQDLLARGCRIDILGSQMHLFNPQECLDLAAGKRIGKPINTPKEVRATFETLAKAGLPIHLSEITITSPGDDERGRAIQAVIARNLYRLWFSIKPMMGITWWNVVDGCGAPGEPSTSGLFTRDMEPKPSYHALNTLINNEWKTRLSIKVSEGGRFAFRGFRGAYRLTYTDTAGTQKSATFSLLKDGDGSSLSR